MWKVDRAMAVWGILFGIAASIVGLLLFGAVTGGIVAESFFLIVLSWVLVLFFLAKLIAAIRERGKPREKEEDW